MLQASAAEMQVYIASNLQALTQEKALIATGNKELYQAIENIKKKIGMIRRVIDLWYS